MWVAGIQTVRQERCQGRELAALIGGETQDRNACVVVLPACPMACHGCGGAVGHPTGAHITQCSVNQHRVHVRPVAPANDAVAFQMADGVARQYVLRALMDAFGLLNPFHLARIAATFKAGRLVPELFVKM